MTKKSSSASESSDEAFLIVGIGAASGGIQSLQGFFQNVSVDSGNAYIVILHPSPGQNTRLTEALTSVASIPVVEVREKTQVVPDHAYIVQPDQHLMMEDGFVMVSNSMTVEERRAPIDIFFRTLGESHGPRAVGVILSGTGANGSMGLKRIKECGGVAYVQNPLEAEFNEMPRNAIETELVDQVLPVAQIPSQIGVYKGNLNVVKFPENTDTQPLEQRQALKEIFSELRIRTGHDFTNYKRPTLLRRIERRMNIHNLVELPAYAEFVKEHADETVALLKDLLISVTNFFRDQKAFNAIEKEVLPAIFIDKNHDDRVRIWVAGCATGEEAYSMAILCAEYVSGLIDPPKVQIFATDIDESAIAVAREGAYTINDAADVSPERLRRFFVNEGEHYRVRKEIREMILFANHNFLKDPPFSRLNLITCRNVLIYFNTQGQEQVMKTFHFALNPGAFLFLGQAESADNDAEYFTSFSREHHIFRSQQVTPRNYPLPDTAPNFRPTSEFRLPSLTEEISTRERITFGELHQRMLEEYAPPSVVINQEHNIVHMSDRVGKYFEFGGGEPSPNLLKLVRHEIRMEIRSGLYQALQQRAPVEISNLKLAINDTVHTLNVQIRPVLDNETHEKGFILLLFQEIDAVKSEKPLSISGTEPVSRQLEDEIVRVKSQLRNSIEQHELQAEELKATNEELQAMNEELRSSAEELETSKEELQSINEELRTVNHELKLKIEEMGVTSNNLQNLITSADVGTIFLDRNFQIKFFTPVIQQLFNLIPSDYGRPITDITNKMGYDSLLQDAEMVLERLTAVDREVITSDGRYYLMRLLPYRTKEDRIDGVVLTFFDITTQKQTEEALRESERRLRTLTDAVPQIIWGNDKDGNPNYFNQRWYEYTGLAWKESVGKGWISIIHPDDRVACVDRWNKALAKREIFDVQYRLRGSTGNYSWFIGRSVPLKDESGELHGWFGSATEIEKLKRAELLQRMSAYHLQIALSAGHLGSYELDLNTGVITSNALYKAHHNFPETREFTLAELKQLIVPDDRKILEENFDKAVAENDLLSCEYRIRLGDGSTRWIKAAGRVIADEANESQKMVGITLDITDQKMFLEELSKQVNERTIQLRRSNEDLVQFAHVASHDLKEPVRKIKTFNSRLVHEFGNLLPAQGKLYLEKIGNAANRMSAMIQGVLNYSMYGVTEESFGLVDLNQVILQVESDLELVIAAKGAIITSTELRAIKANYVLMHQLFYNLINNSLKFSRPDVSPVINITHILTTQAGIEYQQIAVTDNGIGFDNEFDTRIFEPFARLNSKDEYEGTGLGLALCKKIVDRHQGFIYGKGVPGAGASITVLLPLHRIT